MATKRDLVEAHAFSRRRLVTAFVSGAPGGREVEPARPGRTIVGGLALAVLLIAAAAITGVFTDTAPADWKDPGLVLSKQKGAAYVIVDDGEDPEVHPVINITSAQLILGADQMAPRVISQSVIDQQQVGADIGILDAPNVMPDQDQLIETGWTACTGTGLGLRTTVSREVGVAWAGSDGGDPEVASDRAFVVSVQIDKTVQFWLIAESQPSDGSTPQAYRYRLTGDRGRIDALLAGLQLNPSAAAAQVPIEWLTLFPEGVPLTTAPFGIAATDLGRPAPGGGKVGEYLAAPSGGGFVLGPDGPVQLTPFAYALYTHLPLPGGGTPQASSLTTVPDAEQVSSQSYDDAHWPSQMVTPVSGETCALLDAAADRDQRVRVGLDPDTAAAASGLDEGRRVADVDRGAGAYVVSGPDSAWAIDAKGRANVLVGSATPGQLGWSDPSQVSPDWVKLFATGVALSRELALCPPSTRSGTEPSCA